MKRVLLKLVLVASIAMLSYVGAFAQNYTQKYNDIMRRYEFFDERGNMVGYQKWNQLMQQWEYVSTQTSSGGQQGLYSNYEYIQPDFDFLERALTTMQARKDRQVEQAKQQALAQMNSVISCYRMFKTYPANIPDGWHKVYVMDGYEFCDTRNVYVEGNRITSYSVDGVHRQVTFSTPIVNGLANVKLKEVGDYLIYIFFIDYLNSYQTASSAMPTQVNDANDGIEYVRLGMSHQTTGNLAKAEEYFKKAIALGCTNDGSVYASLADVLTRNGKNKDAEAVLIEGYTRYPNNQGIAIGLISYYIQGGEDPLKVLPYIKKAQQNEPSNASLYLTEAMLYDKLGDLSKAEVAYKESIKKNPKSFYAQYGLGALYYNQAIEFGKKADALPINDQAGYDSYIKQINEALKKSIDPFEAAFAIEPNEAIVESLKNVYNRFINESPQMKDGFKRYDKLMKKQKK